MIVETLNRDGKPETVALRPGETLVRMLVAGLVLITVGMIFVMALA